MFWGVEVLDSWLILGRPEVFFRLFIDFWTEIFLRLIISSHKILFQMLNIFLLSLYFSHFLNASLIVTALIFFWFWLGIDLDWFLIDWQYLGNLLCDLLFL